MRVAALALALSSTVVPHATAAGLTSPEPLLKAYDLILEARFDDAERQLATACPPAPGPACEVLAAVNDYWRLMLNPEDTTRDTALLARINAAIASGEAWVSREPKRAEAWFYLGGAYGTRVLLRGLRGQYLSAARDGKRIHDSLQLAIKMDPSLGDAYFGLGLYHYYAAIAPRAARIISMLMFLPGGDRAGGLREMEQTRSGACFCAVKPTINCTSSTCGTNASTRPRSGSSRGSAPAIRTIRCSIFDSPTCRATTSATISRRCRRIDRCSTPRERDASPRL